MPIGGTGGREMYGVAAAGGIICLSRAGRGRKYDIR